MTTIQHRPIDAPVATASPPDRATASSTRAGGVLGILFVATTVIALIARGHTPWWNDPVDTIRSYWVDHGDRYLVSQYAASLAGVILFSGFLVALSTTLDRRGGPHPGLSRLVMLAGYIHIVFLLGADAAWATLGSSAARLDDESLVLLMSLDRGAYQAAGFTLGLFVAATAVAILTGHVFPRWLGVAGLVPAVGLFLSPLSILDDDPEGALVFIGFVATLLTMLFIVILSVMIARSRQPAPSGTVDD